MKLYKYMKAEYALETIRTRKIKVTTTLDANDPNEWLPRLIDPQTGIDWHANPLFRSQFRYYWSHVYGFLSLSEEWDNLAMWGYYGDRFGGIVLVFDVKDASKTMKVVYCDKRHILNHDEIHSTDESKVERLIARKATAWEHENEYRILVDLRTCTTRRMGNETIYFSNLNDQVISLVGVMLGPESTVTLTDIHEVLCSAPPLGFACAQLAHDSVTYKITTADCKVWNGSDWVSNCSNLNLKTSCAKDAQVKWMYLPDGRTYAELAPLRSMREFWDCEWQLGCVFEHAETKIRKPVRLFFRGSDFGQPLGDKRWIVSTDKLRRVFNECRRNTSIKCSDWDFYLLMRHAGVKYTTLLDWSLSPEIAVWFAIHDKNGQVKENTNATLWVLRYTDDDILGHDTEDGVLFPADGGSRSAVYFPYEDTDDFAGLDGYVSYQRPTMQKAVEVRLRFNMPDQAGNRHLVPMDEDAAFSGKLLRIDIEGDFGAIDDELKEWLLRKQQWPNDDFMDYLGLGKPTDKWDYAIPRKLVEKLNADFELEVNK